MQLPFRFGPKSRMMSFVRHQTFAIAGSRRVVQTDNMVRAKDRLFPAVAGGVL